MVSLKQVNQPEGLNKTSNQYDGNVAGNLLNKVLVSHFGFKSAFSEHFPE